MLRGQELNLVCEVMGLTCSRTLPRGEYLYCIRKLARSQIKKDCFTAQLFNCWVIYFNQMIRALTLLSGGLDSTLAAWLIKQEGIEVTGLIFRSCFFDEKKGVASAEQLKIPHRVIDFSKKHLAIVKKPKYGYGSAANPCIDCHLLMLKTAAKILKKEKYDFVVTGEVLGQRPFSQNKQALELLAKKSGLNDKLLRPLSAKLLPPTLPEKRGLVNRKKLLDIQGRGREKQIKLAKLQKLTFPQPAGGCLLCEKEFAKKFFELQKKIPKFNENDARLLKFGRHIWVDGSKVVIGRNQDENKQIEELTTCKDLLVIPANFAGPTALIKLKVKSEKLKVVNKTKNLILKYSNKKTVYRSPIVFFGTTEVSAMVLEMLTKAGVPVGAAITKTDEPSGRGYKLTPTPIARYCQQNKIPVFKLEKLDKESSEETKKTVGFTPSFGICAIYGNFIGNAWLGWCGDMVLNLHPSLLPKHRGGTPVVKTILADDKATGVTIIRLTKGMDSGPILCQKKVAVKPTETTGELKERLFKLGAEELIKILKPLSSTKKPEFFTFTPQNHKKATFALAKDISKQDAEINWGKPAEFIDRQIRAFNPEPGAYTFIEIKEKKLRLKIWRAHLENNKLVPDEVQLEGKNRVSWKQFHQAYPTVNLTVRPDS